MAHKSVFLDILFECHSIKPKFLYNKFFFYKNLLVYDERKSLLHKKTVYYCAFHNIQESKMLQVLYKTY